MEGSQVGTLYKLSINVVPPVPVNSAISASQPLSTALAITNTCDVDLVLWHNRMGHVNVQVLKNMSEHTSLKDFSLSPHGKFPQVCGG